MPPTFPGIFRLVSTSISPPDTVVKCSRCSYRGPQSTFPQKANLSYLKTCFVCKEKEATRRDEKRSDDASPTSHEIPGGTTRRGPAPQPKQGHSTLEWNECISLIETHKNDAFELEAFVLMTGDSATTAFSGLGSGKAISDAIAQIIWGISGYRFM